MNFEQFVKDYRIQTATPDMEHYRQGWIHIRCPCCDDTGTHLGFNIRFQTFTCWRCHGKSPAIVVKELLHIRWREAFEIVQEYTERPLLRRDRPVIRADACLEVELPFGCDSMQDIHRQYLLRRNYNPEKLESVWNLMGTGALGDYKFRIIAPITVDGRLVSFQGRDITDRAKSRYKAAELSNEVIHHKDTVYGLDMVPYDTVVIVEGLPSVWRLGPGAVATFGTGFTPAQINVLSKFQRRIILYDSLKESDGTPDQDAIKAARELGNALALFKGYTKLVFIEYKDPGLMPQNEADQLMKELMA